MKGMRLLIRPIVTVAVLIHLGFGLWYEFDRREHIPSSRSAVGNCVSAIFLPQRVVFDFVVQQNYYGEPNRFDIVCRHFIAVALAFPISVLYASVMVWTFRWAACRLRTPSTRQS
jgi:hypothetical protein